MAVAARIALGVLFVAAAASKVRRPDETRSAFATFGLPAQLWWMLPLVEAALGAGVVAGFDLAAYGAAALCAAFAAALALALYRGRAGAPCGCFGGRSRVSAFAATRATVLAAAFASLPTLPGGWPSKDGWLVLGLALAFVLIVALAIAVLALAREVGLLRLRLGNDVALEIADEGPPVGEQIRLIERFGSDDRARFALAVFSSEGCTLCRTLEPVVAAFARDPLVALEVFDEHRDADVWQDLGIPGSPFAVALGRDGSVGAKGTFNSFAQLESILAAAERRLGAASA